MYILDIVCAGHYADFSSPLPSAHHFLSLSLSLSLSLPPNPLSIPSLFHSLPILFPLLHPLPVSSHLIQSEIQSQVVRLSRVRSPQGIWPRTLLASLRCLFWMFQVLGVPLYALSLCLLLWRQLELMLKYRHNYFIPLCNF